MTKALLPILGACLFAGWMGWLQMGGVLFLLTMFALSGWMVWFRFALTWRSFTDLMVIPSFWGGVLGAVYALSLGWRRGFDAGRESGGRVCSTRQAGEGARLRRAALRCGLVALR